MSATTVKIHLKIGQIEVDYEGRESFLEDGLYDILNMMPGVLEKYPVQLSNPTLDTKHAMNETDGGHKTKIDCSMSTIARRMHVKTGPDLVIAASAYLTFSEQKETFPRADILAAMKKATGHYKKSMSSNLAASLKSLVNNKCLNETSGGAYAVVESKKKEMEKILAQPD